MTRCIRNSPDPPHCSMLCLDRTARRDAWVTYFFVHAICTFCITRIFHQASIRGSISQLSIQLPPRPILLVVTAFGFVTNHHFRWRSFHHREASWRFFLLCVTFDSLDSSWRHQSVIIISIPPSSHHEDAFPDIIMLSVVHIPKLCFPIDSVEATKQQPKCQIVFIHQS